MYFCYLCKRAGSFLPFESVFVFQEMKMEREQLTHPLIKVEIIVNCQIAAKVARVSFVEFPLLVASV